MAQTTVEPPADIPEAADGVPDEAVADVVRDGLWLGLGGFVVALHLVVISALAIFAYANQSESADELVAASSTYIVAGEFFFDIDPQPDASPIEMTLDNRGEIFHNLEIEQVPGFVMEADPGELDVQLIELQPGLWVIYCSVPGHRDAGMEAELTVGG